MEDVDAAVGAFERQVGVAVAVDVVQEHAVDGAGAGVGSGGLQESVWRSRRRRRQRRRRRTG